VRHDWQFLGEGYDSMALARRIAALYDDHAGSTSRRLATFGTPGASAISRGPKSACYAASKPFILPVSSDTKRRTPCQP
jgi:hypothetical protein